MLCAVCQHQDFLQVTSIQGTQMRRRNGLGIFDGLRKFFGETHQLLSYPAFPTSLTLGWQSSPNNLNGFLLDKELDTWWLLHITYSFLGFSASKRFYLQGSPKCFTSQHWLCLCRSPLASLFGKFLCRTSSAIPLSLEKIVEPRYNELNEPPFLLTHLGNLQWRVLGCREACKDIGYKLVKQ